MNEMILAMPQPETVPNTVLPASGRNSKPGLGKKSESFGAILDSATEIGVEPGKNAAKNAANDNFAFLALTGIVLGALPVNMQNQASNSQQADIPAAIAPVGSGEIVNTRQTAVINTGNDTGGDAANEKVVVPGFVQTAPMPVNVQTSAAAQGFPPVANAAEANLQALPAPQEVPAASQSVQPEQAGNSTNVSPQQAAILNDLLRSDRGQAAVNIGSDELAVLSVKVNPMAAQPSRAAITESNPVKKNEDIKSSTVTETIVLSQDDSLQKANAAVAAKDTATPGQDEQQDKPAASKQTEQQGSFIPSDFSADYARVESGGNRQAVVVEQIQPAGLSKTGEVTNPATGQQNSGMSQDTHNIAGQIVEQARMINRVNNSEMVVKLRPEHLGELTLKVTVEKGAVSASFQSNNPEVRSVIEASLTQLRQELSNQGLKVENVSVYAGLNQFFSNDQQQTAQQQQIKFKNRRQDESFIEAVEEAAVFPSASEAGVDYRI